MSDSQNRSMQDDNLAEQSTMMIQETHPLMFAHMSTRHLQQASQRTLNHDQNENDESKATIT